MDIKYLDNYFAKEIAFQDFIKVTKKESWTKNKFKKALKAYCHLNSFVFNPKDLQNAPGRIVQKIDGKSQEAIFIRTIAQQEVIIDADVKEYENENEIFGE